MVNVMISVWKWRERMSNLPPSLPPAGSDPWGLHLAACGSVERCGGDICDTIACLARFTSWRALQKDKQMLAARIPSWKVFDKVGSFLPCLVGGGQVESRAGKLSFSKGRLFRDPSWGGGRNLPGSDRRTFRLLNCRSIAVLNGSVDLLCVWVYV